MRNLFERWGAVVVRYPLVVLLAALVLVGISGVGLSRITVSNGVHQVFVSKSEAYRRYVDMKAVFPSSELDAVIVVSDPELFTPARLEALRNLHLDLMLQPGVKNVVSLFSSRRLSENGEAFDPLVPNEIPSGAAFASLVDEITTNPLVRNRLVSSDASTMVFNVGLDPAKSKGPALLSLIDDLRATAEADLEGQGLSAILTGTPVMQAEADAINASEQVMLVFSGFAIGALICLAYFRRVSLTLLALTVPVAAIIMTFSTLGWLGVPLTVSLQIVAPLVIVIAFNNAMHMLFAVLHSPSGPDVLKPPVVRALGSVGPASLMTSVTSAIAFFALMTTDSNVIRSFGALAAFGTFSAFLAVVTIIPPLVVLLIRYAGTEQFTDKSIDEGVLASLCIGFDTGARRWARPIVGAGVVLFVVLAIAQSGLAPRYLVKDNVPWSSETRVALETIDEAFGGSQPLRVLVRWDKNDAAAESALLDQLAVLDNRLEAIPEIGSVLSAATLSGWVGSAQSGSTPDLEGLAEAVPEGLWSILVDRDAGAALVTAMVRDQSTAANRQLVDDVAAVVAEVGDEDTFTFDVTGSVALSAVEAIRILGSLQTSLLAAVGVIILLIGVTFRHVWPAVVSILPNIFPLAAGGALLAALGGDLTFAGAIAMTVAFGIAVDDTIHMIYRFRREYSELRNVELALERTMAKIGPVLIVSTFVLIAGLGSLFFSELPNNVEFGRLTIFIFGAALVGDLLLLPALVRVFERRIGRVSARDVERDQGVPAP